MAIYLEIEENLAKTDGGEGAKPHSFYKLGKVTGISQNSLSRLRQGSKKAINQAKKDKKDVKPLDSISFDVLERICKALDCQISDILIME